MGGTLSRASEVLHLSQSSVSHRLKELEDTLGLVLIDRQKGIKSVSLTPAGAQFLPIALQWQAMQLSAKTLRNMAPAHFLSLGSVDSVLDWILPPVLTSLRKNDPPVYFSVSSNTSKQLYKMVESREVDLAFVLQKRRLAFVSVTPVLREKMLVIRSPGTKIRSSVVNARDLDPRHELRMVWGGDIDMWHDSIWNPVETPSISLVSVSLLVRLLQDAEQWALVPESTARPLQKQGYVFHRIAPAPPNRVCYLISHRYPRPSAVAPMELLQKKFAELVRLP